MPKMGPYGSPQFMGWVATQRRESVLSLEKKVLQTTVEQMKVEFSTELGKVMAKAVTLIDSAKSILKMWLMDTEEAKKKARDEKEGESDAAVALATDAEARARAVVSAEELKAKAQVEAVEAKWAALIEKRTAVDITCKPLL